MSGIYWLTWDMTVTPSLNTRSTRDYKPRSRLANIAKSSDHMIRISTNCGTGWKTLCSISSTGEKSPRAMPRTPPHLAAAQIPCLALWLKIL